MLNKEFKRKDVERMRNLIKGNVNESAELQVGYTAKNIGLTFNMYVLCVVWALSAVFLIRMIRAEEYCSSAS